MIFGDKEQDKPAKNPENIIVKIEGIIKTSNIINLDLIIKNFTRNSRQKNN